MTITQSSIIITRFYNKLLVLSSIGGLFVLRPMALGYAYTRAGLVILLATCIGLALVNGSLKISSNNWQTFRLILLGYMPVFIYEILSRDPNTFQNLSIICISTTSFAYLFSIRELPSKFIRIISSVFSVLVISACITLILSFPENFSHHELVRIDVRSRSDFEWINIYYPITTIYTFFWTTIYNFPRFNYFFIEAGLVSGFFASLIFANLSLRRYHLRPLIITLLVIGAILSFSTTLVPTLVSGLAAWIAFRKKFTLGRMVISVLAIIVLYYATLQLPFVGILSKSETHGSSFQDRVDAYAFTASNIKRYLTAIAALVVGIFLALKKTVGKMFLPIYIPLFVTGIVNVAFFSPMFIALTFFAANSAYIKNLSLNSKIRPLTKRDIDDQQVAITP